MLVFQLQPPAVDWGAKPAHILIHCKNGPDPNGMFMRGSPQPSPLMPGGSWWRLITSCGMVSMPESKSPNRHSPKAIVLEVPSTTSLMPRGRTWSPAEEVLPPYMNSPFGDEPPDAPTQCRLEPTDAK